MIFSSLLNQLLDNSIETNRCRAKLHRMNSNSSSYQEYCRYVQDGNKSIAGLFESLSNGKYVAETKEQELTAIEDIKNQAESHDWEIVLLSQNTTSTEKQENITSLEKRDLLNFLATLKSKINSGEQARIEKSGQESLRREKKQQEHENYSKKQEEINKILQEAQELNQIDRLDLNIEDYYRWKRTKTKLDKLKNWNDFQNNINEIQTILNEIEKHFPSQILLKIQAKKEGKGYCSHREIYWPTIMYWPVIFQKDKPIELAKRLEEKPYCLNCGEDKSKDFCKALERWSIKETNQWLVNNKLKTWEFQNFLRKKNYLDIWNQLQKGTFTNDELNSLELSLLKAQLEHIATTLLSEFAKEKGIKIDIRMNREREREQLQQAINNLANKPNRTPAEEAELEKKKKQLAELGNHSTTSSNSLAPFNWKPWMIGTIVCLVIGMIVYFSRQKSKNNL